MYGCKTAICNIAGYWNHAWVTSIIAAVVYAFGKDLSGIDWPASEKNQKFEGTHNEI